MDYLITGGSIEHHGVKGMKWGVRKAKYDSMSGTQRRATKKKYISKNPRGQRVKRKNMTPAQRSQSNRQIIGYFIGGPIGSTIAAKTGANSDETTRTGRNFIMANLLGPFGASTIYTK